MKTLKLGLALFDEDDNLVSKRFLNVNWEIKLKEDARLLEDIRMKEELVNIITTQVKIDLDKGAVEELLNDTLALEN